MWPVQEFYDGSNELSVDETLMGDEFERHGRKDLADIVRHGRKYQRLVDFLGGAESSKEFFPGLINGFKDAFGDDIPGRTFEEWKEMVVKEHGVDVRFHPDSLP